MRSKVLFGTAVALGCLLFGQPMARSAPASDFSLDQTLGYPFITGVAAAKSTGAIAWVQAVHGVRNIWAGRAPDYVPRQLTQYTADDGQELTKLTFSPDGSRVVYVRGGDHDANWPAEGNLAPDPDSSPNSPRMTIWSIATRRRRAGEDRRGRRAGRLRPGASRLRQGRPGLDRAAGRRQGRAPVLRSRQGRRARLVAGRDAPGLRLRPRRSRLRRRVQGRRTAPLRLSRALHEPRRRAALVAGRPADRLHPPPGRGRAAGADRRGRARSRGRSGWRTPHRRGAARSGTAPRPSRARSRRSRAGPTSTGSRATGLCSWPSSTTGRTSIPFRRRAARRCC